MSEKIYLLKISSDCISKTLTKFENDLFKRKGVPKIINGSKKYTKFDIQPISEDIDIKRMKKILVLQNAVENSFEAKISFKNEEILDKFISNLYKKIDTLNCDEKNLIKAQIDEMTILDLTSLNHILELHKEEYSSENSLITLQSKIIIFLETRINKGPGGDTCSFHKAAKILIPKSMQFLGQTLILNLNLIQNIFKMEIADFLWSQRAPKNIYRKSENVSSVNRTTSYELLRGPDDTDIKYIENGIRFSFDLKKVYFNSKLNGARDKLLFSFKKGDIVADLFCGIGPISLRALKKGCKAICNDINPDAILYLKKNLRTNGFHTGYEIFNECAKDVLKKLAADHRRIDHFVFNLPELSLYFIPELKEFQKKTAGRKTQKRVFSDHISETGTNRRESQKELIISSKFERSEANLVNFISEENEIDLSISDFTDPGPILHCFFFCKTDVDPYDFIRSDINVIVPDKSISLCRNVSPSKDYLYLRTELSRIQFSP